MEEDSNFLWDFVCNRSKEQFDITIGGNYYIKEQFETIVKKIYLNKAKYENSFEMNKAIIHASLQMIQHNSSQVVEISQSLSPPPQPNNSIISTNISTNISTRNSICVCDMENVHLNNKEVKQLIIHKNLGFVKEICCKTMELYDCCVYEEINEINMINQHYLREYLTLYVDIYVNNNLIGENIILTQQNHVNNKILFVSNEAIPYNNVCTKIEFVLKDANMNTLSLQYDIKIKTMIAGFMLQFNDSLVDMDILREPTFFSFLLDKGEVTTGDILEINEKKITVLTTATIVIKDESSIIVTKLNDTSYNAFFCKLDNKYKLANTPDKIKIANMSKMPIVSLMIT